mgnify:CR=1 FL=1
MLVKSSGSKRSWQRVDGVLLLDKPGGYLSDDLAPPGLWLDNMPAWEYGVLVQVRDMSRALRKDFARSQSQSTEDTRLIKAEQRFNFDNKSWALPATEVEYRDLQLERVVLVSVWTQGTQADVDNALAELKLLAETAGSDVLEALVQRRSHPDPATFIGRGKVDELREVVIATGADTVICDGELAPSQRRALEDVVKVKVIDRTALILDIFAQHAKSAEGKAQVELAQLQYLKQRLRGWGGNLSRQAGGRAAGGAGIVLAVPASGAPPGCFQPASSCGSSTINSSGTLSPFSASVSPINASAWFPTQPSS